MRIKIDFNENVGKIKPMHGMTNSPIVNGSHDYRRHWKRAGIPFARLHDTDYPKGPVVDIPRIFPDFRADENDPANYTIEKSSEEEKADFRVFQTLVVIFMSPVSRTLIDVLLCT